MPSRKARIQNVHSTIGLLASTNTSDSEVRDSVQLHQSTFVNQPVGAHASCINTRPRPSSGVVVITCRRYGSDIEEVLLSWSESVDRFACVQETSHLAAEHRAFFAVFLAQNDRLAWGITDMWAVLNPKLWDISERFEAQELGLLYVVAWSVLVGLRAGKITWQRSKNDD